MKRIALKKLGSKPYRDALVYEHIRQGVAFQINATREQRGWSQRELGEMAGMPQEQVSRFESAEYGGYTLRSLLKLASAFDSALIVRFVPFGELLDWTEQLGHVSLAVPSYDEELEESDGDGVEANAMYAASETASEPAVGAFVAHSSANGGSTRSSTGPKILPFIKRGETPATKTFVANELVESLSSGGTYGKG